MFCACSKLKELNLSNFNTNDVAYVRYMFNGCPNDLKIFKKNNNKN